MELSAGSIKIIGPCPRPARDAVPNDSPNARHDDASHCVPNRDESCAVILAGERVGHGADGCGKQSNGCSRKERLRRRALASASA
jgi:hypothetical protein